MPLLKGSSKKVVSNEELAYIAGIFDGEGCVCFERSKNSYYIGVVITNTHLGVLEYIQDCFGGSVLAAKKLEGRKRAWAWKLRWSPAIEFLTAIEPWLRVKEDQAHLAFCWDYHRPGVGKKRTRKAQKEHDDVVSYMRECLTFFNKRGDHNLIDPVKSVFDEIEWQNALN